MIFANQKIDNKSFHRSFNSDKNDLYILAFRKSFLEYGMFHQTRVDGGQEFFLSLGIQEQLSHLRSNQELLPYRQTGCKRVSNTLFAIYSLLTTWYTKFFMFI